MALAAPGFPRIGPGGLQLEGQATNLVVRSMEFGQDAWTPVRTGAGSTPDISGQAAVGPDGTATAVSVAFDRGAGDTPDDASLLIHNAFATVVGETYAAGLWARADQPCIAIMRHVGADAYLTMAIDGTWRRFLMSSQAFYSGSSFQIGLRGGYGTDAACTVQLWNAQCEAGHTTSDVRAGAAPGVRAADALTLDHATSDQGTVLIEFLASSVVGVRTLASSDGEPLLALVAGVLTCTAGGGSLSVPGTVTAGTRTRAAVTWEPGRRVLVRDGAPPAQDAASPTPGGLEIGSRLGADPLNGWIRIVRRLDRAVSNAALVALTS